MSRYGEFLHLTIFGQSHAPAIGMTLEGLPAGETIDMDALQAFLDRRAPGQNEWSTPRKEADQPEFLSGLVGNVTCGAPLTAIIRNTNTRSGDYDGLSVVPRPGHADYTAGVKYGGHADFAGGGAFSGRLTAPLCIAGGICLQLLKKQGIEVISRIASIGSVEDVTPLTVSTADKPFPVVDDAVGETMRAVSGVVEPVGGFITILIAGKISPILPYFLSFAAGAMLYVVVEELIPEAQRGEHSNIGTIGTAFGFALMMVLDVALG